MSWVRPGVELVFTRFFRFINVLIRDDFPTLDRPAKAISCRLSGGYCVGFTALFTNSVDLMIIIASTYSKEYYFFIPLAFNHLTCKFLIIILFLICQSTCYLPLTQESLNVFYNDDLKFLLIRLVAISIVAITIN
jgi:hypothetical protein